MFIRLASLNDKKGVKILINKWVIRDDTVWDEQNLIRLLLRNWFEDLHNSWHRIQNEKWSFRPLFHEINFTKKMSAICYLIGQFLSHLFWNLFYMFEWFFFLALIILFEFLIIIFLKFLEVSWRKGVIIFRFQVIYMSNRWFLLNFVLWAYEKLKSWINRNKRN